MSALVLALLMGCTSPMQVGNGAPPPGRLTVRVADAALAAGLPDMALRAADLILRDDPHNVPALLAKGDALYAMGHPDLARGAYRMVVAIDPSAVDALIGLGRTLVRTDPKAAEAAFLDAAMRAPDNVTALSNLGIARDLQGQHEAAQAAYRQALAVAPNTADVKLNLGLSLALSGRSAEAVAQLRPLLGETGSTDVPRNDLAAALALAGDQVEAGSVLRGDARPADLEAATSVARVAETPVVVVASLIHGPGTATPDEAPAGLLDIRPASVVPVVEVASLGAPAQPGTKATRSPGAVAALVSAPARGTTILPRPARSGVATAKVGATTTDIMRSAAHVVAVSMDARAPQISSADPNAEAFRGLEIGGGPASTEQGASCSQVRELRLDCW